MPDSKARLRWLTFIMVWIICAVAAGLAVVSLSHAALLILALAFVDLDARSVIANGLAGLFGNLPLIGNFLTLKLLCLNIVYILQLVTP